MRAHYIDIYDALEEIREAQEEKAVESVPEVVGEVRASEDDAVPEVQTRLVLGGSGCTRCDVLDFNDLDFDPGFLTGHSVYIGTSMGTILGHLTNKG